LILLGGPHEARPSVENVDRTIENLQKVPSVFMVWGGISSAGGSIKVWTGSAGDAEAWEEVREAIVALGAQEEGMEGPAEEGPVQGP
jgi:hypothetical protein